MASSYMNPMVPQTIAPSRATYLDFVKKKISEEQTLTRIRSFVWYFGWPLFFFIVLAPGFLVSLPPAIDCDDGVRKPIAPERTTVANVFVHAVIFISLIVFMYWFGAKVLGILFPFTSSTLDTLTYSPS